MIDKLNGSLLFSKEYKINNKISIKIPTIKELFNGDISEQEYYSVLMMLSSVPYDLQAQLDEIGIDYTQIDEWQLFQLIFTTTNKKILSFIFNGMNVNNFELQMDNKIKEIVLRDAANDIVIDRVIQSKISNVIRKMNFWTKTLSKAGNEEAKQYILKKKKKELKRQIKKPYKSTLESIIVALVNEKNFKYNYETVQNITIYQLNVSLHQIMKEKDWGKLLNGVYAGTVDTKSVDKNKLTWIEL